jgi:hypothetical protein
VTEAPPGATPTFRDRVAVGWGTAAAWGAVAFGAVTVLAGGVALLGRLGQATLVPALVNRVPIDAGLVTFQIALLLATAAVGWLLFRGGRAVAGRSGGPFGERAAQGAKVAVPFALLTVVVALAAVGGAAGTVAGQPVSPSVPGSFVWPLLLGAATGAAGGVSAAPPGSLIERRTRAVLSGGWRMTWLATLLGIMGFLVVMALHPAAVRAFVDAAFRRGPAPGTLAVAGTTFLVPNAGTGVASAAMGGGVELEALGASCTVVSYTRIPEAVVTVAGPCGRLPFRVGTPAPGYYLFLVLPPVATLSGGWLAARRSGSRSGRDGAAVGALAGVAFGGLFAVLSAAARITYEATGQVSAPFELDAAIGPDPVTGLVMGLLWGAAGGAAGGWLAARRSAAD